MEGAGIAEYGMRPGRKHHKFFFVHGGREHEIAFSPNAKTVCCRNYLRQNINRILRGESP